MKAPMCRHCHSTGSLSKSFYGQLDCAHCDVAGQRVALAEYVSTLRDEPHVVNWLVHVRAHELAQGTAEPVRGQVQEFIQRDKINQ